MSGDRGIVPVVGESVVASGRSRSPPEGEAITVTADEAPPLSARRWWGPLLRLAPTLGPPPEDELDRPRR